MAPAWTAGTKPAIGLERQAADEDTKGILSQGSFSSLPRESDGDKSQQHHGLARKETIENVTRTRHDTTGGLPFSTFILFQQNERISTTKFLIQPC